MPNLVDLFGNNPENFNLDDFLAQAQAQIEEPVSAAPAADEGVQEPEVVTEPPPAPHPVEDPHFGLVQIGPDEWVHPSELEDLVNLHRQITAREPRQVLSGGAPAAAPPAESRDLPEWLDPDEDPKFVKMYRHFSEQNQALREAELARQQAAVQQQVGMAGARAAASAFAQKYGLSDDQVGPIAMSAGNSGLAKAMELTHTNADGSVNYGSAYFQALETEAFRNEQFRPLVSAPRPDPTQAKPEDVTRQRTLTGLSAAASPSSAPAEQRPPAETRPDGRLAEISRSSLVNELAAGLMRERQG
jgi:hypothetical protein